MSLSKQKKFFESEAWQLFFKTLGRAFLICAIFCIFYGAYFVAEQTFSNQPYNAQSHKKVTISVTENRVRRGSCRNTRFKETDLWKGKIDPQIFFKIQEEFISSWKV